MQVMEIWCCKNQDCVLRQETSVLLQLEDLIPRAFTDSGHMFLKYCLTVGLLLFLSKFQWSPSLCQITRSTAARDQQFTKSPLSIFLFLWDWHLCLMVSIIKMFLLCWDHRFTSPSMIVTLSTFLFQSFNFSFWAWECRNLWIYYTV